MFRKLFLVPIMLIGAIAVSAQPSARPSPTPSAAAPFQLSDYGVQVQPDPRLIIVMAALDAAGFDPTPPGKEPSAFRRLVRKDQEALDPDLRQRLKTFYERNRLPAPATPADQAARYVSLAYAIGQPPL